MNSTWAQAAAALIILAGAALVTRWFARAMYITCSRCGMLNARRRTQCRGCGEPLPR